MKQLPLIILLFASLCCFGQDTEQGDDAEPKKENPFVPKAEKTAAPAEPIINPVLIFGMNASQVWGDQLTGYRRVGANAGAGAFIRLPKHFSVSFEVLYSMKGANSGSRESVKIPGDTNVYYTSKLILDYIDVPIMFNYQDKRIAIFGAGVNYTSLVRYKEVRNGKEYEYPGGNPYKVAGLEFVANVTFVFAKHYGVNLRYNMSILNINKEGIIYSTAKNKSQQNNYLTLRFMYFFK